MRPSGWTHSALSARIGSNVDLTETIPFPFAYFSVMMTALARNTSGPCLGKTRCRHGALTNLRARADSRPKEIQKQSIVQFIY